MSVTSTVYTLTEPQIRSVLKDSLKDTCDIERILFGLRKQGSVKHDFPRLSGVDLSLSPVRCDEHTLRGAGFTSALMACIQSNEWWISRATTTAILHRPAG